jgi:hypothetical protein
MSFWKEIRNDYVCEDFYEEENCKMSISIDGYKTIDNDENGQVIARVLLTTSGDIVVVYFDYVAKNDEYAQEKIKEAIEFIKENSTKEKNS